MQTFSPPVFRSKATALLLAVSSLLGVTQVSAQTVFLTFSWGSGSPFVVSWSEGITYTLTSSTSNSGVNPYFVFQTIVNITQAAPAGTEFGPGGGPTYTSTGAGSGDGIQTINSFYTMSPQGVIGPNDLVFRATADTANTFLTAGDVITLTAGHLQNNTPYGGVLPGNGFYNTFITDASYQTNLGSGVSGIPEPSTYAVIAGSAMLGIALWRRRNRSRGASHGVNPLITTPNARGKPEPTPLSAGRVGE